MSFVTGTQVELLYALPAAITKNTYTTIAAISGVAGTNTVCSIPPGWLLNDNPNPLTRSLSLCAMGTIANTAAATFAMNINVNPTVATTTNNLAVNTAYTPLASNTTGWFLDVWFTCTAFATSTFTLQANGRIRYENVATGGVPSTGAQCGWFQGTWTGLDPRVQQYVEIFGTWSVSNAANTTTLQQMFLWGLN